MGEEISLGDVARRYAQQEEILGQLNGLVETMRCEEIYDALGRAIATKDIGATVVLSQFLDGIVHDGGIEGAADGRSKFNRQMISSEYIKPDDLNSLMVRVQGLLGLVNNNEVEADNPTIREHVELYNWFEGMGYIVEGEGGEKRVTRKGVMAYCQLVQQRSYDASSVFASAVRGECEEVVLDNKIRTWNFDKTATRLLSYKSRLKNEQS